MQKQKMVLAFEEGISDRFEDFSTLPKDVRALYPKLNPSMIARVTWAYKSGGCICHSHVYPHIYACRCTSTPMLASFSWHASAVAWL